MKRILCASAAALVTGCGGGGASSSADGGMDTGGCVPTAKTNPYCQRYPTTNVGTTARAGATPGKVIPSFSFSGYRNTHPGSPTIDTAAPVDVALANFYDPQNKQFKLLVLSGVRAWCSYCNLESIDLVGAAGALGGQGVVLVQALSEGETMGVGADLADLTAWIPSHPAGVEGSVHYGPRGPIDFNAVLDPEFKQLIVFDPAMVTPLNLYIDVRTMEILARGEGLSASVKADIEAQLAWVEHHPPSYPLP